VGNKAFDMEQFFAALADRTRLRLINLMALDEICVCFFVEVLGESQPKVSRHLAYLRRAGLVEVRRDGKWSHYRLAMPADARAAQVFREVVAWLAEESGMKRDRQSLAKVCCAPQLPVQLQGAPRPANITA
jgi:ArsR family transcriptional regulator, arsenate/arsenite/antimonite-responsive transcriptional repressor